MSLHTLSVLVEDKPGVLARVANLFARRGFNIHSLAVGTTQEPGVSRMTLVVDVKKKPLEQVTKHLNKLINVLKVVELSSDAAVERELALFKVRALEDARARVIEIADIFRARVVDVTHSTLSLEASGTPEKVEALKQLLEGYGIVEMVRTGRIALARGERSVAERPRPRLVDAAEA
jgi:acetolactate synthase-1/3 small subunit